jgi:hypothetical protein
MSSFSDRSTADTLYMQAAPVTVTNTPRMTVRSKIHRSEGRHPSLNWRDASFGPASGLAGQVLWVAVSMA